MGNLWMILDTDVWVRNKYTYVLSNKVIQFTGFNVFDILRSNLSHVLKPIIHVMGINILQSIRHASSAIHFHYQNQHKTA